MNQAALILGYLWIGLATIGSLAYLVPQVIWWIARRTRYGKILWVAIRRVVLEEEGVKRSAPIPGAGKVKG